ncbi:MAG: ribonuclease M5 [Acidaminococcus sp.]|nr:ribonuclease M5 [Acidaminococcus sp.]MCI2099845.1 ribonuclease M5 [Acidaminococcus sp.]MCI2114074.1 ribonuclease M5 [Acidaminococcus sp.]MCI2115944.1 ribonuclease M5 [Acidaminococcus sp.]
MIKEVIVVEGKMDTVAVKKAVDADTIETGGFTLAPYTLKQIAAAYEKRGIIIMTDPDGAGERIRRYLTERFPEAGQAFVPKAEALAHHDVGIEQAQPEAIRKALSKVRHREMVPQQEFTARDLFDNNCSGSPEASLRRDKLGALLGIGYGNVKKMVERLNHYGVTREEFNKAVAALDEEGKEQD